MPTITLTASSAIVNRITTALQNKYTYTGFLPDGITPESKADFLKRCIVALLKDEVKNYESLNIVGQNNLDIDNNTIIT